MAHILKIPEPAQVAQKIRFLAEAKGKAQSRIAEIEALLRSESPADLLVSHVILCEQRDALDIEINVLSRQTSSQFLGESA